MAAKSRLSRLTFLSNAALINASQHASTVKLVVLHDGWERDDYRA